MMRMRGSKLGMVGLLSALAAPLVTGCVESPLDFGEPRSCDIPDQNEWVYGVMQEIYLWTDDMPEVDPREYESPGELVRDLRVGEDRWSRVSDKATTDALFQEGKYIGLGFKTKRTTDGGIAVSTVHETSPAGLAGMRRGDRLRGVSGFTVAQLDESDGWSEAYGPGEPGVDVPVEIQDGGGATREFVLTKSWIDIVTVPEHRIYTADDGSTVGYLFFQTFVEPAIEDLDAVFEDFVEAGVTKVVIDVRYNGGGLIKVSRHMTNLLVGDVADGDVNYRIMYNDNLSELDDKRSIKREDNSIPGIEHVAFIATGSTLSASELLINSVRAHVPVDIIGDDTGGKPVGSKHVSFCDSVLRPITFRLLNADFESDYFDGLSADCIAIDDLGRDLGDPREGSLAAALAVMSGQGCPGLPEDLDGLDAPPHRRDVEEMQLDGRPLELQSWY